MRIYTCPMHPEVQQDHPGSCPKCGMALELKTGSASPASVKKPATGIYTCPMHPEVQQDHPGACPKCGMALELKGGSASPAPDDNAELHDMTRRFWIGTALTVPVFVLAMVHEIGRAHV